MFLIRNFVRIRSAVAGSARIASRMSPSPAAMAGSACARRSSASAAPVSTTVPDGSTIVIERSVWYEFSTVPQHIPLALLATTPPIVAAAFDAGSGPSRYPWRLRAALARARMVPGLLRRVRPPSSTVHPIQCRMTSTRIPSPWDCPDRLVPAARNVTGIECACP